jgi:N-acetyl-gamma-glutamylphosphate reductase
VSCCHTINQRLTLRIRTGVTGYIAGDAMHVLYSQHPEYEYACLVRSKDKAELVKKAFPNVRIVLGGLDDSDLLEEEAMKADIILRTTSPDPGRAQN